MLCITKGMIVDSLLGNMIKEKRITSFTFPVNPQFPTKANNYKYSGNPPASVPKDLSLICGNTPGSGNQSEKNGKCIIWSIQKAFTKRQLSSPHVQRRRISRLKCSFSPDKLGFRGRSSCNIL